MRLTLFLLLALLAYQSAAPVSAQATVGVGDRVRLSTIERQAEGVVLSVSPDTVVVALGEEGLPLTLSVPSLTSLEVRGPRARVAGAFRGAAVGAAVSGVVVVAAYAHAYPADGWEVFAAVVTGMVVTPPLVITGGAIGATWPGERWRRVPLRASVGLSPGLIAAAGGGVGIGLRLEW